MNAYVVYCHPDPNSFTAAVRERAVDALRAAGHQVRISDLYAEGFEPALSLQERLDHLSPSIRHSGVAEYCDNLRWSDALVFIYPTWWSGQPAMLTGWFDRVLVRGVAWDTTEHATRIRGELVNIRRVVAITSHGSGKFLNLIEGESGRRVVGRAVRALCHRFARTTWLAMYNLDRSTDAERQEFLNRVERQMRDLWSPPTSIGGGRKW